MQAELIIELLERSKVRFMVHKHPPIFTVEDGKVYDAKMPGAHCKNMLLSNKKKTTYYLIILEAHKQLDFKGLGAIIEVKGLKFATDETLCRFDSFSGAISPFLILEDHHLEIEVYMEDALMDYEILNFHPNINTMTLGIGREDFIQFMKAHKHPLQFFGLNKS